MFEKSLHHFRKLEHDLTAARSKLAALEAETPVVRARLVDLLSDETSTAKEITAARQTIPTHLAKVDAAREEVLVLQDAAQQARAVAVEAGRIEWSEAVSQAARDLAVPLDGLPAVAEAVRALADDMAARWETYVVALHAWGKAFPGVPVPKKPAPIPSPELSLWVRTIVDMSRTIGTMRDKLRAD